ncbi:MAG: hypothetical protein HRT90_10850 [Candidatus Margulisbacteria bacterium]|nr:hypothetical protein [Candidatus Margulisiibacteriota bacterium]
MLGNVNMGKALLGRTGIFSRLRGMQYMRRRPYSTKYQKLDADKLQVLYKNHEYEEVLRLVNKNQYALQSLEVINIYSRSLRALVVQSKFNQSMRMEIYKSSYVNGMSVEEAFKIEEFQTELNSKKQ